MSKSGAEDTLSTIRNLTVTISSLIIVGLVAWIGTTMVSIKVENAEMRQTIDGKVMDKLIHLDKRVSQVEGWIMTNTAYKNG